MPLKSGYSRATFSANVAELIRAGHERNSAIMTAASRARASYFSRFPRGALPNWLAFPKAARLASHYDSGGRPLLNANPRLSGEYTVAPGMRGYWIVKGPYGSHSSHTSKKFAQAVADKLNREGPEGISGSIRRIPRNPVERPSAASLAQAKRLYEGFTGVPPRTMKRTTLPPMPETGLAIGKIFGIMYQVDATGERLHHEFKGKARPTLIVSADGKQVFMRGGAYTFTKRGFVDKA